MANSGIGLFSPLCVSMCFVSTFYTIFLIKERSSNSTLLQFISGVKIWTFWLTHLIWDYALFTISVILVMIIVACFPRQGFPTFEELGKIFAESCRNLSLSYFSSFDIFLQDLILLFYYFLDFQRLAVPILYHIILPDQQRASFLFLLYIWLRVSFIKDDMLFRLCNLNILFGNIRPLQHFIQKFNVFWTVCFRGWSLMKIGMTRKYIANELFHYYRYITLGSCNFNFCCVRGVIRSRITK